MLNIVNIFKDSKPWILCLIALMAPRGRRHSGVGDSEPSSRSGRVGLGEIESVTGCNLLAIYIRWQGGELTHPQFEKKNNLLMRNCPWLYNYTILYNWQERKEADVQMPLALWELRSCSKIHPISGSLSILTCSRLGRCGVYVSSLWNQVAICSKGMEGVSDWKEITTIQNPNQNLNPILT